MFQFCLLIFIFSPANAWQKTLGHSVHIIQENLHSWCGLTVCESGRWETVKGWLKPPSVMRLLCYFFFWLSCCDRCKHCLFPRHHVSLRQPSHCQDHALGSLFPTVSPSLLSLQHLAQHHYERSEKKNICCALKELIFLPFTFKI